MIFPKTHKSHTCRYDNDKNCYYSQQVIITLKKPLRTPRAVIYAFPFFSDTWRLIGKHKKTWDTHSATSYQHHGSLVPSHPVSSNAQCKTDRSNENQRERDVLDVDTERGRGRGRDRFTGSARSLCSLSFGKFKLLRFGGLTSLPSQRSTIPVPLIPRQNPLVMSPNLYHSAMVTLRAGEFVCSESYPVELYQAAKETKS